LPNLNKQDLSKQASELGFIRDTFEKVHRLSNILNFINRDPLLSQRLALKGGTAINLTIFDLPRLSVDIDLDYSINNDRDSMMTDREQITELIKRYMNMEGYEMSSKSKTYHSLDSFVFAYINAGGMKDNIKTELNYSLRCHVLPLEKRPIETLSVFNPTQVISLAPIEIFGSKIVALLSRAAARDLYDINNMLSFGLFDESQEELLRKCVVFYIAIGSETVPETLNLSRIDSITNHKIRTDLYPVISKNEKFELATVQKRVKEYLSELLVLTDDETQFLDAFREKDYRPELLFSGEVLERVKNHPMALWKMRQ